MMARMLLLMVLLLAPALTAQVKDIVGQAAPAFSANVTISETEHRTLADCAGDVVVIRIF